MAKVSFVIPTLNRERYVGRAVASCIAAGERANVTFEVIVLDSQSDDGSWEMLEARFGADDRVLLRQNQRGLGPTRSWLDGAEFITGNVVTFVWSDDYVADTMLVDLLPTLVAGGDVAIGRAAIRDVQDDSSFPARSAEIIQLAPDEIACAYYGVSDSVTSPPVSPACALFSRRAFDRWRHLILTCADDDLLVQQLLWRRAIGPDLLLFLVALDMQQGPVSFVDSVVTQFSSHPDSISIRSPTWLLQSGYLAARVLALRQAGLFRSFPRQRRNAMLARTALQSLKIARGIPDALRGLEDKRVVAGVAKRYAGALLAQARREAGWPAAVAGLIAAATSQLRGAAPHRMSMAALG